MLNSNDFYDIEIFDLLRSTNTTLKEMATLGAKEGKVIIAKEQSQGRGKIGRSFFSPKGSGVYMSILLKPDLAPDKAVYITSIAAVAVAEAIEEVSGEDAKIKWVNDVYLKDKKVCGILTESAFGTSADKIGYAVVGIGINLKEAKGGFPADISHIAGAVFDEETYSDEKREKIIDEILKRFLIYYKGIDKKTFVKGYKTRSNLIGEEIEIVVGDTTKRAKAIDIDDDCHLLVEYENGEKEALISGDVTKIKRL